MARVNTHISAFKHDRKLEVRMMKLMKEMNIGKSELIRNLINEAYDSRIRSTKTTR